jgi:hypothetical protein
MIPVCFGMNGSLLTQGVSVALQGGAPQEMREDSDSAHERELKSIEGKRLPLSLGRKQDRDKEE